MTRRAALANALALTVIFLAAVIVIGGDGGWFESQPGEAALDEAALDSIVAEEPTATPAPIVQYVYQDFVVLPTGDVIPAPPGFPLSMGGVAVQGALP